MYESAEAVCPYYHGHTAEFIRCEDKKKVEVDGWKGADKHIRLVCGAYNGWRRCPIAKDLNKKYGV